MAEKIEVGVVIKGASTAAADITKVGTATKKLGSSAKGTGGLVTALTGTLDTMTAGAFSGLKRAAMGLKVFITGLKTTKTAIIATGIGALVIAFGLLVAYWDDIKTLVDGVSSSQNKLLKDTKDTVVAAGDYLEMTEGSEASLKLAGKSEREIRDLKIEQTNEVILATEALLNQQKMMKKTQVEAAERNQKISAGVIGFLMAPVTVLLMAVDALTYGLAKLGVLSEATSLVEDSTMWAASFLFDPEEVAEQGDAVIDETENTLRALKNKRDGFLLQNQADTKASAKAESEAVKASEKEKQDAYEETYKLQQELNKKILQDAANAGEYLMTQRELEKISLEDSYLALEDAQAAKVALLEKTGNYYPGELKIQKQILADLEGEYDRRALELTTKFIDEDAAIQKAADDKTIAREKATADAVRAARLGIVAAGFDALKSMAKTEEGQKRLAISQILVNQGIAMSEAFKAAQVAAAATGPAAPVMSPLFTAQMIGMVLASFASIKGVMNQAGASSGSIGTSSGGGGGGSTQLALTPSLESFEQGTLELPAVQAYILQNNIADADALAQALQNQSSL